MHKTPYIYPHELQLKKTTECVVPRYHRKWEILYDKRDSFDFAIPYLFSNIPHMEYTFPS